MSTEKSIARAHGPGWRVELLMSMHRGKRLYTVTHKKTGDLRSRTTESSSLDFARTIFSRYVLAANK